MVEPWQAARDRVLAKWPDARPVLVSYVIRDRWRIFADGLYRGLSQKYIERAWLAADREAEK